MKNVRLFALGMFALLLLAMLVHSVNAVSFSPNSSVTTAYPYFSWTSAWADDVDYYNGKYYTYGAGFTASTQFFIYEFDSRLNYNRLVANVTPIVPLGLTNVGGAFNGTHHYFYTFLDTTRWYVFDDATGLNTENITIDTSTCSGARPDFDFKDGYLYSVTNANLICSWMPNGTFVGINWTLNSNSAVGGFTEMGDYLYVTNSSNDVITEYYKSNSTATGKTHEGLFGVSGNSFILGVTNNGSDIITGNNALGIQVYDDETLTPYNSIPSAFQGNILSMFYNPSTKLLQGIGGANLIFNHNQNGSRNSILKHLGSYGTNFRGISVVGNEIFTLDDTGDKIVVFNQNGLNTRNDTIDITGTLRTLHWDGNYFWIRDGSNNFRRYNSTFDYTNFLINTSINHSGRGANGFTSYGEYGFMTLLGGSTATATTGSAIALYNTTSGQYLGVEMNVSNQSIYNALGLATNGSTLWVSEINNVGVGLPRVHTFQVQSFIDAIPQPPTPVIVDTFPCDVGTLNTTCIVNSTKNFDTDRFLNGTGNIIITSTGSLTANASYTSRANLVINITGDITIMSGGSITTSSRNCVSTCDSQPNAQQGGDITIYADVMFLNGTITANGGTTLGFARYGGAGGNIRIIVNDYDMGTPSYVTSITANGQGGTNQGSGANGGTIIINSVTGFFMSNISSMNVNGGNGQAGTCGGAQGHRGSGGLINVTANDVTIVGSDSAIRGISGACNDGSDGQINIHYSDILINNTYSSQPFTSFIDMTPALPVIPVLHITPWFPQSMDNLSFNDVPFNVSVNITSDCELFINLSSIGIQTISPPNTIQTHSTNTLSNGTFQYFYQCEVSGGYFFNSTPILFYVDEPFIPTPPTNDTGNQTTTGGTIDVTPLVNVIVSLIALALAITLMVLAKYYRSGIVGICGCFVMFFGAFLFATYSNLIAFVLIMFSLFMMYFFGRNGSIYQW